jgi:hypothetical protein
MGSKRTWSRVLETGLACTLSALSWRDEPVEGLWFDRTQESAARRRGETFERDRFATPEITVLSPLPCWRHLSPEKQRERVAEVVREIEEETAARRQRTGVIPLGRAVSDPIRSEAPDPRSDPIRSDLPAHLPADLPICRSAGAIGQS